MNASIVTANTSAIISIIVIHVALPAGTPILAIQATLTTSPPMSDGVVEVTNSPASRALSVLPVELMSLPTKERIKYLNLYACKKNLVMTATG